MARSLARIAQEVRNDWKKVNYAAEPYLQAMFQLNSLSDKYYSDQGLDMVLYFLSNAQTWRGPVARRIKAELKAMVKEMTGHA